MGDQDTKQSSKNAAKEPVIAVIRELARAYQAFASYDAAGHRGTGLTVPQADVIFTLGNTDGLTFKEIGELTLITKGTLTGIIDRLESKTLVSRIKDQTDRRSTRVALTKQGKQVFEREFPRQVEHIKKCFDGWDEADMKKARRWLRKVRKLFE